MAATLKDVAKLAEVDIGSVSRTLGNHPRAQKLRPETRQRILDAARKLGYRRNQFAAAMRTGVNATIAIINSGDYSIGHSQSATRVLYGILDAAGASNYALKTYTDNDLPSCIEEIPDQTCHFDEHEKRQAGGNGFSMPSVWSESGLCV